jgi:biotin operon repressor
LEQLDWFCRDQGWARLARTFAQTSDWIRLRAWIRGAPPPIASPPPPPSAPDPDDYPRTSQQDQCEALLARISLCQARGPQAKADDLLLNREELRETIRRIRVSLDSPCDTGDGLLSQPKLAERLGLSSKTVWRLENLERKGTYLPHRSTLRKLAEFSRTQGWEEQALHLEKAAGWERRHRYPERKSQRGS